jgi:hypothetical protein
MRRVENFKAHRLKEKESMFFFCKKRTKKTSAPWVCGTGSATHPGDKSFFASFFSKKEDSSFLKPYAKESAPHQ